MAAITPTQEIPPELRLSLRRIEQLTGIGRQLLRRAIDGGELPAERPGDRTIFVAWRDVERWLASTRLQPRKPSARRVHERLEHELA